MTELEALLNDWKAVYGELHPTRPAEQMLYNDSALALALLMRREIELIRSQLSPVEKKPRRKSKAKGASK